MSRRNSFFETRGSLFDFYGLIITGRSEPLVKFLPSLYIFFYFAPFSGLTPRGSPGGRLGLYDGDDMVFLGSEWDVMLMLQFLWRYGWDIYRVLDYVKSLLANFDK